jgi:predicted esterase
MKSGRPSKRVAITRILSIVWIVASGCGTSDGAGAGSGGSGGFGGTGPSAAGGTSGGGGTGPTVTGGSTGTGGVVASGGAPGSGGNAGGQQAGGGQLGTAGQAGRGTGGGTPTGGATGTAGQAGRGTGGSTPTGGTTGTAGQAGRGTGGSAAAGGTTGTGGKAGGNGQRSIAFGTLLDAQAVMTAAQQLAKSLANPSSSQWQAKGDQHRKYRFAAANADEPYRLYVPTNWDGKTSLPLAMFLHGSGSDENSYVDSNNKQMLTLAQQHGYLLVAPLGDKGAYGNFLRLSSPFGKPDEAAKLIAQITADSERTNELSEQDVINVLELVLAEYPIDRGAMFLFGHSMGSGGTWYIGGKYAGYWKGLAPMSGPFVQEKGYPWDDLRNTFIFVTEGTQTPSLDGSHALRDWLKTNGFKAEYKEVNADHGGMIPLVLPDVFDFFDRSRAK